MRALVSRKQLRGCELRVRISDVIRSLTEESLRSGKRFVLNISELARRVPTTRRTLSRHERFISEALESAGVSVSKRSGKADNAELIAKLELSLRELKKENQALRRHHASIYSRLRANSVDVSILLGPHDVTEER